MGAHLRWEYTAFANSGESSVDWKIEVHNSTHSGSVIPCQGDDSGAVFSYQGENDDRLTPLITSEVSFIIKVANTAIEGVINSILGAPEEQFTVIIYKDNLEYWYGYVLADKLSFEDLPKPYYIKITAVDGISRLKTQDYIGMNNYTGRATLLQHLQRSLDKMNLSSLYNGCQLRFIGNWESEGQIDIATKGILRQTLVQSEAFYYGDERNKLTYLSCFDVIKEICRALGARFFHANNKYYIVQSNYYETTTVNYWDYELTIDDTTTATGTVNWDETVTAGSFFPLSGGNFGHYPALKQAKVNYKHYDARNFLLDDDLFSGQTIENIDDVSGAARLAIKFTLQNQVTNTLPYEPVFFKFRLVVRLNNAYWLKSDVEITANGIEQDNPSWETSLSYYEFVTPVLPAANAVIPYTLQILTPPLLDSGDLFLDLDYIDKYTLDGQIDTESTSPTTTVSRVYVEVISSGSPDDQETIRTYTATNNAATNSVTLETETLLGDGPTNNTKARFIVITTAQVESNPTGWRAGTSGSYSAASQLLANQMLAGQKVPTKKMLTNFTGNAYEPWKLLKRGSERYVFQGGKYNTGKNEWRGEWWLNSIDETGITEEPPESQTTKIPPFDGPGGPLMRSQVLFRRLQEIHFLRPLH